ncbi:ttl domain containing protein [Stylonychia lemnae]|uniref:Ttl domain containing protein n=1 Tax=Stylonychia lemnae TaxID=5949 RepID=A0A078B592_STYLE|nr:ttl domain containing protein [Stylonychia lemnae]|eukprot:CDW88442.1 ttl domain containing protein [Stylonychia lemnae]
MSIMSSTNNLQTKTKQQIDGVAFSFSEEKVQAQERAFIIRNPSKPRDQTVNNNINHNFNNSTSGNYDNISSLLKRQSIATQDDTTNNKTQFPSHQKQQLIKEEYQMGLQQQTVLGYQHQHSLPSKFILKKDSVSSINYQNRNNYSLINQVLKNIQQQDSKNQSYYHTEEDEKLPQLRKGKQQTSQSKEFQKFQSDLNYQMHHSGGKQEAENGYTNAEKRSIGQTKIRKAAKSVNPISKGHQQLIYTQGSQTLKQATQRQNTYTELVMNNHSQVTVIDDNYMMSKGRLPPQKLRQIDEELNNTGNLTPNNKTDNSQSLIKQEGSSRQNKLERLKIDQDMINFQMGQQQYTVNTPNSKGQVKNVEKKIKLKKQNELKQYKTKLKNQYKRSIDEISDLGSMGAAYIGSAFSNTSTLPFSKQSQLTSTNASGMKKILGFSQLTSTRNLIGDGFKFQVLKGNNAKLVQRVLSNRYWWTEMSTYSKPPQFKWSPCSIKADFPKMNSYKQIINHFENHREITRKDELLINLTHYFSNQNLNVFDYVPVTFQIIIPEGKSQNLELSLKKFQLCYDTLDRNKYTVLDILRSSKNQIASQNFADIEKSLQIKYQLRNHFQKYNPLQIVMPVCHFVGGNMWVLKTTSQNRGRGIHVFKSYKQLKQLIRQYIFQSNDESSYQNKGSVPGGTQSNGFHYIPKTLNFVIQKYIERPMLINKRKFDIRVWVLVNQDMDVFFFKEGYLRTTCAEYKLDNVEDQYIHLTNNAVQRNASQYGQFEDGNQLSFQDLQRYIQEHYKGQVKIDVYEDLVEDMKYQVVKTLESIKKKLNSENRKFCFEIFGFDFIIDQDFNVWLIECNTNPCLDESSGLLRILLPRMLDDAFKLTIDKIFPNPKDVYLQNSNNISLKITSKNNALAQKDPLQRRDTDYKFSKSQSNWKNLKTSYADQANYIGSQDSSIYPIEGYSDYANLWDKLMNLTSGSNYLKVNERRIRSDTVLYSPEGVEFFATSFKSYKEHQSMKAQQLKSVTNRLSPNFLILQTSSQINNSIIDKNDQSHNESKIAGGGRNNLVTADSNMLLISGKNTEIQIDEKYKKYVKLTQSSEFKNQSQLD